MSIILVNILTDFSEYRTGRYGSEVVPTYSDCGTYKSLRANIFTQKGPNKVTFVNNLLHNVPLSVK